MKKWLIVVLVLILIPTLVLGYLGFVPGLSFLMGSSRPRDLGVRYTEADLKSVMAKNGVKTINLSPYSSVWVKYEGKRELKNVPFTQEEITARMNNIADTYKYAGVKDMQARFNEDGTVEVSGRLDLNMWEYRADDIIQEYHLPEQVKTTGKDMLGTLAALGPEPPFYIKGTLSVANNKITMDPEKVEVGRAPLPMNQVPPGSVERIFEQAVNQVPGLFVRSLTFEDGNMVFDGNIPEKTYHVPK